jgi:hypothetical protein
MKLHAAPRAPHPWRVAPFIAEQGIGGIGCADADLGRAERIGPAFRAKNPHATNAEITVLGAPDVARGLMRFRAGAEGFAPLPTWRDRPAERPASRRG